MTNQSTIQELTEMHLSAMAVEFRRQLQDPGLRDISFEDRLGMMVDVEYATRKRNRLKRLIHDAEFEQPNASIMDLDYVSGRKLNRDLIQRLATCEYIHECRNIFITGATGCGKSYMACAFGMEACKQYFTVKYVRLPDLLIDLHAARGEGNFLRVLSKYTKPTLLIIDEWLIVKPKEEDQEILLELFQRRMKQSSAIFCSQYSDDAWYDRFSKSESPLADAILDRIVHDAYRINIKAINPENDRSMREVYGMSKEERE